MNSFTFWFVLMSFCNLRKLSAHVEFLTGTTSSASEKYFRVNFSQINANKWLFLCIRVVDKDNRGLLQKLLSFRYQKLNQIPRHRQ